MLSLPVSMRYAVVGKGTLSDRLITAASVTGSPVWSAVRKRSYRPIVFGDGLSLYLLGTTIILR